MIFIVLKRVFYYYINLFIIIFNFIQILKYKIINKDEYDITTLPKQYLTLISIKIRLYQK